MSRHFNVYFQKAVTDASADLFKRAIAAILKKFMAAEAKHGWKDAWTRDLTEKSCQEQLLVHLDKGDPKDVAIYCFFMIWYGWRTRGKDQTWEVRRGLRHGSQHIMYANCKEQAEAYALIQNAVSMHIVGNVIYFDEDEE